eukprot:15632-Heterococcus_DN1.PRE.3
MSIVHTTATVKNSIKGTVKHDTSTDASGCTNNAIYYCGMHASQLANVAAATMTHKHDYTCR